MSHPLQDINTKIAAELQTQLEESHLFTPFLGLSVTIWDEKLGRWNGTCGNRNLHTREPLHPDELFYIYSITKTFTAVAVLKLLDQTQLTLDTPVSELLAELPKAITFRHLLNHTSGLPNYTEQPNYEPSVAAQPHQPWPEATIWELIREQPSDFQPGCGWHYSNTGYFVLKKVVEHLSGRSFAQALTDLIIAPLGLRHTKVATALSLEPLIPGYSRELSLDSRMEDVSHKYHPGWCFTGLVAAATADVVKFYRELLLGDLLAAAQVEQLSTAISTDTKDPRFGHPAYGLGVMIDTQSRYGTLIGHAGDGPGYTPWVMYLPDFDGRPLTLAIFGNTGHVGIPLRLSHDLLLHLKQRSPRFQ
ncbi:MAG: serine hydrolase domain-containing protein [Cyanobacteria bacterium P01_A01_bin.17]